MARVIYQDKVHILSDGEMEGKDLHNVLQVPPQHDLVLIRPEGNVLVSGRRKVRPVDGDYFVDAPTFEYGSVET
jgi:hypothetical protein